MSGGNEDGGGGWGSRFLKGASVVAASAAVAGGLYALLSSSASANSHQELPFGGRRELKQGDDAAPSSRLREASSQVGWTKPEIGWVKLNVDGSRDHSGPSAGCGGVLRNASGTWCNAFALKLDPIYEAHETELQAILVGLERAFKMNVEKLIVESDNESMVNMVENDGLKFKNHRPEYGVVERIRELRFDPNWQVKLVSINKSANRVAHRLANKARTLSSDVLQIYATPPDKDCELLHLEDILQAQAQAQAQPRFTF
ncbi:hypothetical protein VNO77_39734 [Canavalia gladiata]|uniref:RNase H type-1 domain-containing protein n=1 Tax=Canavalia gladiata TaxID=3824 RepID=A0AAN9JZ17_CANGL